MTSKVIFKYDELDENGALVGSKQLDFIVAILGNFSGKQEEITDCFDLDSTNFHLFFENHKPTIEAHVPNLLFGEEGETILTSIQIQDLEKGFRPSVFYKQLDFVIEYIGFLKNLEKALGQKKLLPKELFSEHEFKFFANLGLNDEEIPLVKLVHAISRGYELLNDQINQVFYSKEFQEIEFNWISVFNLIVNTSRLKSVKIKVFDLKKQALYDDLVAGQDITDTELFYHIFTKELDQYGGNPVNMILNSFKLDFEDVRLAEAFANLGKYCSCPVISSLDANVFDVPDISHLINNVNFKDYKSIERFYPWTTLAKAPEARFLGFLVPEIKVREAYAWNALKLNEFPFSDKNPNQQAMQGLYGTAVYLFALPFMRSYEKYWSCFGAEDEDCAVINLKNLPKKGDIIECVFPEKLKRDLSDFGVMSFGYCNSRTAIKLGELNMYSMASIFDRYDLTIEQRMNVRLPQLLFISQLTHYMRMIKRNNTANKTNIELKNDLLAWLRRFISDTGNLNSEIQMTKPLKSASVDLVEVKTKRGSFIDFRLSIVPHSRYRGLEYGLNL